MSALELGEETLFRAGETLCSISFADAVAEAKRRDEPESSYEGKENAPAAAANNDEHSDVLRSLSRLKAACIAREHSAFVEEAEKFVEQWQGQRTVMETHSAFVHADLMADFVSVIDDPLCVSELSWHALKVSCLLARADLNTQALLRAGGVGAALGVLRSPKRPQAHLEVALALLQNVAFSSDGVASILREGGVSAVLAAMRAHVTSAAVQRVGLGVLWNLCDSEDHWSHFLASASGLSNPQHSRLSLRSSPDQICSRLSASHVRLPPLTARGPFPRRRAAGDALPPSRGGAHRGERYRHAVGLFVDG